MKPVKDSGTRRTFETGAQRDAAEGKGRYDLLPCKAIRRLAMIYESGAKKYDDNNWRKGIPLSKYLDSGLRHAMKWADGWDDEDHLAMACWNFMCALETEEMIRKGWLPKELEDIYEQNREAENKVDE